MGKKNTTIKIPISVIIDSTDDKGNFEGRIRGTFADEDLDNFLLKKTFFNLEIVENGEQELTPMPRKKVD